MYPEYAEVITMKAYSCNGNSVWLIVTYTPFAPYRRLSNRF